MGFAARSEFFWRVKRARSRTIIFNRNFRGGNVSGAQARTPPTSRHAYFGILKRHRPVTVSATRIEIVLCESIVGEGQDRLLEVPLDPDVLVLTPRDIRASTN